MTSSSKKESAPTDIAKRGVGGSWAYGSGAPILRKRDPMKEVVAKPMPGTTGFDVYDRKKKHVGHKENIEDARQLQRQGEVGRYLVRSRDGVLLGKPTSKFDPGSYYDDRAATDDGPVVLGSVLKEKK